MLKYHCVHACTKRHSRSEMAVVAETGWSCVPYSRHPYKCLQQHRRTVNILSQFSATCSKKHSSLDWNHLTSPYLLQLLHSHTLHPYRTHIYTTNRSVSCLSVLADMKLALLDTSSINGCLQPECTIHAL